MTKNDAIRDDSRIYKEICLKDWWNEDGGAPASGRFYSVAEQKASEKVLANVVERLAVAIGKFPENDSGRISEWGLEVFKLIRSAAKAMDLDNNSVALLLDGGFMRATRDFIKKTREFDYNAGLHEKMQALRNVWIMNSIQVLAGKEVVLTPSLFAYSLLYPYTDNFLDSKEAQPGLKEKTGENFRKKLEGMEAVSSNRLEEKLFRLVDIISEQYPFSDFPLVYKNLQNIHKCQQQSLLQQIPGLSPYEADVLGMSIEKGGASVMADAYLVDPELTGGQAASMFAFGVFLQLADDLQDVEHDKFSGHATIFSQSAGKWPLDGLTTRLFSFMDRIICFERSFAAPGTADMSELIKKACSILLQTSVAQNRKYFSSSYLKEIEKRSPVRFIFYKRTFKKIEKEYEKLKKKCETRPFDLYIAEALSCVGFKAESEC